MVWKAVTAMTMLLMLHGGIVEGTLDANGESQSALKAIPVSQMSVGMLSRVSDGAENMIARAVADAPLDGAYSHCEWLVPKMVNRCERLVARIKERLRRFFRPNSVAVMAQLEQMRPARRYMTVYADLLPPF